ncbi:Ig-like domain-containing protein [Imperialibacter roseus]|uniref:Ig-like domain-containing protein n=1 Tax=Imperialibacter roseus TaxID=1324217 RepID=A0ABZ0II65_9BACT|nr:Ig-like domain-containing protein [Imperialibacter roseus]WOK04194.1 Ig-like domain-containing protein [Imperialibacter roseus]
MKKTKNKLWTSALTALFFAVLIVGCKDENEGIVGLCPVIVSTDPVGGAVNVPLDQVISATFNEAMNGSSITQATFSLGGASPAGRGLAEIEGTVSYDAATFTVSFVPAENLRPGIEYTATVAPTAKDQNGNFLQAPYVWTFTTNASPTVVSTDPINLSTNILLNKVVTATFSEAMDPLMINGASFTLMNGTTQVAGVITYDGLTAFFTPSVDLLPDTDYSATITTGAMNLTGEAVAADFVWTFNTGMLPAVTTTAPINLATGVLLNQVIEADFSEAMDPLTITPTSFTVKQGTTSVPGTVAYSGTKATFTPTNPLSAGTTYTATVTNTAANPVGIPLAGNYVWNFDTGVLPTVVSTDPLNLATGVPTNKVISATFSEAMNPATITSSSFTLMQGTNAIAGTVSYSGTTATFTPTSPLLAATTYTANVTTGATSQAGFAMGADFGWSFDVGVIPTVLSTDPLNLATGIPLNKVINATFSESMDPLTITSASFTLMQGTNSVAGAVSYTGTTASFTPTSNLLSGKSYTATITTAAKSVGGIAIPSNHVWSFSTVAPLGPPVVNLNSLLEYGIIAGVGVTNNAGASEIHDMNVGIYPGARSSITGFFDVDGGPGLIFNGAFHASDDVAPAGINAALNQAQSELVQAYDDAKNATTPAPSVAPADLGGQTLAPGIWTSATTMLLQNGDLTLDAQGDENAVWIFQVGSAFTSVGGAGGNVILAGGAKAKNVFWQVSSSATIGDNTIFKGNILAFSSITMNAGSVAEGRMLARNGSVQLISANTITRPPN